MRHGLAVGVLLVALTAGPARANDPSVTKAIVQGSLEAGANGEAYRYANDLIAQLPEDPDARILAAQASLATARLDEGRAHLDAAIRLDPERAELWAARASLRFATGDDAGAVEDARRAIVLAPDDPGATAVLEAVDLVDKARRRRSGEDPGLPAGSPAAFVDELCAAAARGAGNLVLEPYFDLEILDGLPEGKRTRTTVRSFVEGARRVGTRDPDIELLGWWVHPEVRVVGDRTWVVVTVPNAVTISERRRDRVVAALSNPKQMELLDPNVRAMLEGVPAEDRAALVERTVGTTSRELMQLVFEVARREDGFRITEVVRNGASVKQQLPLYAEAFGEAAAERDVRVPSSGGWRERFSIGYVIGALVAIGAALIVWVRRR